MPWDIFPVEKLGITQVSHEYHPSIIIKVPNDFQKKGYRPKPPPHTGLHAPVCSAGSTCLLTTANAAHALQCSRRQRARRPREPGRGGQRREEPCALLLELLQHAPEEGTQSELLRKTRKFQPTATLHRAPNRNYSWWPRNTMPRAPNPCGPLQARKTSI